jgi:hypothetical protein
VEGGLVQGRFRWGRGMSGFREGGGFEGCAGFGKVVGGLVQGRFRWGRGMGEFREGACG